MSRKEQYYFFMWVMLGFVMCAAHSKTPIQGLSFALMGGYYCIKGLKA